MTPRCEANRFDSCLPAGCLEVRYEGAAIAPGKTAGFHTTFLFSLTGGCLDVAIAHRVKRDIVGPFLRSRKRAKGTGLGLKVLGKTETKAVAPDAESAPVPVRRTEELRLAVPGTTTEHAPAAVPIGSSEPLRSVCRCAVICVVQAIFDPFPDIAAQVMKAKLVRFFLTDFCRAVP